jgi:hypothetical protein
VAEEGGVFEESLRFLRKGRTIVVQAIIEGVEAGGSGEKAVEN